MVLLKRIKFIPLLSKAYIEFRKNDPLRMAGATAFFTSFALPAVLIILIQVFRLVLSPRFMSRQPILNLGELMEEMRPRRTTRTLLNVGMIRTWYEAHWFFFS